MRHYLMMLLLIVKLSLLAAAQQGCEAVLSQGIFDTVQQSSFSYGNYQFHQAMCLGQIQASSSGGSTSIGINFGGTQIPLGLSFDDARQFQTFYKNTFCNSAFVSEINQNQLDYVARIASPTITAAYSKCVDARRRGLLSTITLTDDKKVVRFTATYTQAIQGGPTPVVRRILVSPTGGADCNGSLTQDAHIDLNEYLLQCERRINDPIHITVDTAAGDLEADLPATPPAPSTTETVLRAFPPGVILAWNSSSGPIPPGWHLCDGTNGTPDLRSRFLRGAQDRAVVGTPQATGGAASHSHDFSAQTLRPRGGEQGVEDGYHNDGDDRANPPQVTGLDHRHFVRGTTQPASNVPPYYDVAYIIKL
jgi:hypothetical protein